MTMLVARQPLHTLSMSSLQRPDRRQSARFQENEDVIPHRGRAERSAKPKSNASAASVAPASGGKGNEKKRKLSYDEEDEGFTFNRVKKTKPDPKPIQGEKANPPARNDALQHQRSRHAKTDVPDIGDTEPKPKERRKRMSFSSPQKQDEPPPRRSKRLSKEHDQAEQSPPKRPARKVVSKEQAEQHAEIRPKEPPRKVASEQGEQRVDAIAKQLPSKVSAQYKEKEIDKKSPEDPQPEDGGRAVPLLQDSHSATRIALPVADTPVNKRNKAMREGKSGKGERRSSLGSRGRRASSLIESGNSNALPHSEVDVADYYKHIESEGLPEPRRMRQLLTWCAERALDEKPKGTEFEDASARNAARAIEEELLKDLSNKSELSDWFSREDVPTPKPQLPERPNPKNVQNLERITELEEQIKRLRTEKEALESFLRPPSLPPLYAPDTRAASKADMSLLSEAEAAALDSISSASNPTSSDKLSRRVNELLESIGPTIDQFADVVHKIGQYRTAADSVASRVLAVCAEKLTDREKEGRKKALAQQDTPAKDLGSVLRSLSRTDR